jgi:DNA invertase Pin-like site-specific DNA recombinase
MTEQRRDPSYFTYARVSHAESESGSCSPAWQRETMNKWLNDRKLLATEHFFDNGVSASVPLAERPEGQKLVANAVDRGDVILIARLDRLFRDVEDFRARLREWVDAGVQLVSCTEALDLTTATGRMIATILAAVSEYERELIGQRTREIRETRREMGLRVSAEPKYGWKYEAFGPTRADGSQEHRLVPDPEEQYTILRIAAWRGACRTLQWIADELTRQGIPTRRGGPWAVSSVADICRAAMEGALTKLAQEELPPSIQPRPLPKLAGEEDKE